MVPDSSPKDRGDADSVTCPPLARRESVHDPLRTPNLGWCEEVENADCVPTGGRVGRFDVTNTQAAGQSSSLAGPWDSPEP